MIAVVDASAATKLFLDEPGSEAVRSVWFQAELSAPTILLPEVASAVRRGRRHGISPADAVRFVRGSATWRQVDIELADRAAALATVTGLRGMDAVYVATAFDLAEHDVDVALLSFDTRQRQAALDIGIPVIPADVPDR